MALPGFAQKVANLIRFLCGTLRIFAASALKRPLNAETQRLDGGPQRRFIRKTAFLCKAIRTNNPCSPPRIVTPHRWPEQCFPRNMSPLEFENGSVSITAHVASAVAVGFS